MDIGRPEGVQGPGRIEPKKVGKVDQPLKSASSPPPSDKVEISEGARMISEALAMPPTRAEKIEQVRQLIESGRFETDERLEAAIEELLKDHPELLG